MSKVIFKGATVDQITYAPGSSDPREHLEVGETYNVVRKEVYSRHTLVFLEGFESNGFNSVCFKEVDGQ